MDEELLVRQMPHSVEAEQSVLGSMLIDARCVPEVIEALKSEDFYLRQNREIYETIYSMFNFSLTIDPVTVLDHMKQNGVYDENTSRNYILQLMEITPTAANVKEYVAIVKDKSLLRRIAETAGALTAMIQEGTGTAQDVLEAAEQRIYAIRQGRSAQGLEHVSSVILNVYERLAELAASDSAVPGLSTGLPDVDMAISGLNKSDLILLAARPGMGKTSFALNMLLHAGKFSGKTVVFFSLEMSREQLAMRLISGESFVDNKKLVTGKLSDEDWSRIAAASAALNKTQILIDDNPALSVADMNAKCRRVDNLGLVVIDYLQLMTSAGGKTRQGDNRQQIVSDISRALKIMAKELNVPVVCLSQLSRGPESRSDKRPMLSDLRESGAIEQDADIVMFLYREDYYNEDSENHNLAECIIAKNRHGETKTVELQWLPEYTTFSSIDRRHQEGTDHVPRLRAPRLCRPDRGIWPAPAGRAGPLRHIWRGGLSLFAPPAPGPGGTGRLFPLCRPLRSPAPGGGVRPGCRLRGPAVPGVGDPPDAGLRRCGRGGPPLPRRAGGDRPQAPLRLPAGDRSGAELFSDRHGPQCR